MTDRTALLAAMAADPFDDTVRLAYADYLEETGEPDRAEFIRVQVELARMNPNDPARRPLVVRHLEFLRDLVPVWRAELPKLAGIEWGDFHRGLIEEVQAADEIALVRHAAAIFTLPAIHVVRLVRFSEPETLARLAALDRVRILRLISSRAEDRTLRTLLASPYLSRLIAIHLDNNRAGNGVALDIADGRFPVLEELWLGSNRVGNEGADALAATPFLSMLRVLDLSGNRITNAAIRAALARRFRRGLKL
jgi:uncharacterized protein (TIGR02996 family)